MTGLTESPIARRIWAVMGQVRTTIFRTNSGKAWISGAGPAKRMPDGTALVPHARPIALGLVMVNGDTAPGLADYCGWTVKTIPPEWVGREVAIFTSVETKRQKNGRISDAQENWAAQVRAAGGIGIIVNSAETAVEQIAGWAPGGGKIPEQRKF